MDPLQGINVVVIVFGMEGCPACKTYLPKLYRQTEAFQQLGNPLLIYQPGDQLSPGLIPVIVYDATSQDPGVQALATQHNITALPCTLLMTKHGVIGKWEGSQSDPDIQGILTTALHHNR